MGAFIKPPPPGVVPDVCLALGYSQTTVDKNLELINAANLKSAHEELESDRSIGKVVLEGFQTL